MVFTSRESPWSTPRMARTTGFILIFVGQTARTPESPLTFWKSLLRLVLPSNVASPGVETVASIRMSFSWFSKRRTCFFYGTCWRRPSMAHRMPPIAPRKPAGAFKWPARYPYSPQHTNRSLRSIFMMWCNTHQRPAERCKTEGGILLPCRAVDLTGEIELYEWRNRRIVEESRNV